MTVCRTPTEIVNRNPEKCLILFEFTQNNDQLLICLADSAAGKPRLPSAYSKCALGRFVKELDEPIPSTNGAKYIGVKHRLTQAKTTHVEHG